MTALWILSYDFKFELYEGYSFRPWRLCLIVYAVPGIIGGRWNGANLAIDVINTQIAFHRSLASQVSRKSKVSVNSAPRRWSFENHAMDVSSEQRSWRQSTNQQTQIGSEWSGRKELQRSVRLTLRVFIRDFDSSVDCRKAILMSIVDQTVPLFKPPYLLHFFACSFLHFGTFSISGGMVSWYFDTN